MKSSDKCAGETRLKDRKAEVMAQLIRRRIGARKPRVLVVGCGTGMEAAILAQELETQVVGVDLYADFDSIAASCVELRRGDATRLEYDDGSFDFVYSYHALEHIPDYARALQEMSRVLNGHGQYCIGTPNRSRLIGYLGSQGTPLRMKLAWNAADWKARLTGRFRNEFGAHAGFTTEELYRSLYEVFGETEDVTKEYYHQLYPQYALALKLLIASGVSRFLFPSIYFFGRKKKIDSKSG